MILDTGKGRHSTDDLVKPGHPPLLAPGIVKEHDGCMIVESEPGRGATFSVYFPHIPGGPEADAVHDVNARRGGILCPKVTGEPMSKEVEHDSQGRGGSG